MKLLTWSMLTRELARLVYVNSEITAKDRCNLTPKFKLGASYIVKGAFPSDIFDLSLDDCSNQVLRPILDSAQKVEHDVQQYPFTFQEERFAGIICRVYYEYCGYKDQFKIQFYISLK